MSAETLMLCGRVSFVVRRWLVVAVVSFVASSLVSAQSGIDLDGRAVNPLAGNSGKIIVLVFLRRDCPVSGRYAPTIQQLSAKYVGNAKFWLVYPGKSDSPEEIRDYLRDYGYSLPVLRDPSHELAKLSHVRITPEVAVFNHNHQLVYDGRIDDWYVDLSRARPAPTTHELDDAVQAAIAGKAPAKSEVRGVGCYISDLE